MEEQNEELVVEQAEAEAMYSDDEIDVFVDNQVVGNPEQAQLIEELKAKQAELQGQVDPVSAMRTAVQELGRNMAPPKVPVDVKVRANGVQDWNAYKENFNTKVFEDPFQTVTDLLSKSAEMQSASIANQNLAYSKRIAQIDPNTSPYYKRWADEIEQEVARMPVAVRASNPNVYEDAIRVVKANHIDELIEERIAQSQTAAKPTPRTMSYSEAGPGRSNVPVTKGAQPTNRTQIRVSEAKMREISAYAEEWGIPDEAAIRLFQKRNML